MGILLKSQYVVKYANAENKLALVNSPTKLYIGPYLQTSTNGLISGESRSTQGPHLVSLEEPKLQKGGVDFIPYDRLNPTTKKKTTKADPYPERVTPTKSSYINSYFIRYFFLDNRTKIFTEVSKSQKPKVDSNIFTLYSVVWILSPTLGPKVNKKIITQLKKLGSLKISPYDHIKNK